jgi:hypothetical protein
MPDWDFDEKERAQPGHGGPGPNPAPLFIIPVFLFIGRSQEISRMTTLAFIALVLGAGVLFEIYYGDFGPDLVLAAIGCFS